MKRLGLLETSQLAIKAPFIQPARYHVRHALPAIGYGTALKLLMPDKLWKLAAAGKANAAPMLILNMMDVRGEQEAVVSDEKRLKTRDFKDRFLRIANWLIHSGMQPKDKAAVLMHNSAEVLETLVGASFAGCTSPGLNWHLAGEELAKTINVSKPKTVFVGEDFVDRVLGIADQIPSVKNFVAVGAKVPKGWIPYEEAATFSRNAMPSGRFIFGAAPYTSGTTGVPKNVNLNDGLSYLFDDTAPAPNAELMEYFELLFCMLNAGFHLNMHKIKDLRSLVITPMYHAGTIAALFPVLYGGTLVLESKFDPEQVLATMQKERISWTFMVPTMLSRILNLPDEVKRKYDLSSMRSLISGAAPCSPEIKTGINELFMQQGAPGPVFHEYYGSTETMMVSVLRPGDYNNRPERLKSVGKPRCGEVCLVDPLTEQAVSNGEQGSICARTVSTLGLSYGTDSSLLDDAYVTINGKLYYKDGLMGYQDKDGFLYLTDRIKDMVISGGVNVFPGEVEKALAAHPAVDDVAVFGVPDQDLGEVMRAEIQLMPGAEMTEEEAFAHCKAQGLFGYKMPRYVGFMEKLPRRIDGKMIKRALKEKYWPAS
ncbi:AMP-binding protein [Desulfatibacillum aliphaticivorans]|uniref:AMP-binding protein n=1 Tax=Desulfatibacillum aliphaticivorans TaxID=218208 RepID=UPI00040D6782|nr:AMP-binding protein [Desulfatibacillum aliphaticivorans]